MDLSLDGGRLTLAGNDPDVPLRLRAGLTPPPTLEALAEFAWAVLEATLTGDSPQWLQLVQDWSGDARLELTEFCIGDLRAAGWLRGCPAQAIPVEGELRLWFADGAATGLTGLAAQPDGSALFRLAHDAEGRLRLNGRDVADLARSLAG